MWPFRRKNTEPGRNADPETSLHVLSVLEPEDVQAFGLPNEAIAGTLSVGADGSINGFEPNPAFAAFMHHVIRTCGPQDPSLLEAAREQGAGYIYLIDLRTPEGPSGNVPPHDIVGAFAVEDGKLGDYKPNEGHLVYSSR